MDREELLRHLEFEYWGCFEAAKRDAEQHGLPFEWPAWEEWLEQHGVEPEDDEY